MPKAVPGRIMTVVNPRTREGHMAQRTGRRILGSIWKEKSREKIIVLLSENGKLTDAGLAAEIGVTAKAVEKHLAKLKAEGIIEREGPDKGGSWKVK